MFLFVFGSVFFPILYVFIIPIYVIRCAEVQRATTYKIARGVGHTMCWGAFIIPSSDSTTDVTAMPTV